MKKETRKVRYALSKRANIDRVQNRLHWCFGRHIKDLDVSYLTKNGSTRVTIIIPTTLLELLKLHFEPGGALFSLLA